MRQPVSMNFGLRRRYRQQQQRRTDERTAFEPHRLCEDSRLSADPEYFVLEVLCFPLASSLESVWRRKKKSVGVCQEPGAVSDVPAP